MRFPQLVRDEQTRLHPVLPPDCQLARVEEGLSIPVAIRQLARRSVEVCDDAVCPILRVPRRRERPEMVVHIYYSFEELSVISALRFASLHALCSGRSMLATIRLCRGYCSAWRGFPFIRIECAVPVDWSWRAIQPLWCADCSQAQMSAPLDVGISQRIKQVYMRVAT